jgi:large subunit ribosomal protein L33
MADRVRVALVCSECDARNYQTTKSRTKQQRIELKKYCPHCARHTIHRESK